MLASAGLRGQIKKHQGFATNSNVVRRERLAPHSAGRMCQGFFLILNLIIFSAWLATSSLKVKLLGDNLNSKFFCT